MHYGFVIPVGDVGTFIDLAQKIEAAGWDGVFIADGVYGIHPWVALSAMAVQTRKVRLGSLLTPGRSCGLGSLPVRRRP
ncbi:LLM class flavin-dependent oxidoreductase [Ktedonobacteria bacterium brp13]|nr:LLM class flavin-dependent oxidoreductase [Ktedonobacteria bacterium brp13]